MSTIQKFTKKDIELVAPEPLYEGFFTLNRYRFRHKLHNGDWSNFIEREIFERGDAVAVLPYDPNSNEFILIEQFRVGAVRGSEQPWLLEVVAGMIEKGEEPEDVCRRETLEESGLKVTELTHIINYLPSPGGCTEKLMLYFALVDASKAGGVFGLDEEDEDILVHKVPEQEAMNWLQEGRIENSATIIALQWFALNREKILSSDS